MLAKSKLNTIEALVSKALIDSDITQNELFLANDVLKEYNNMREAIKSPGNRDKFIS